MRSEGGGGLGIMDFLLNVRATRRWRALWTLSAPLPLSLGFNLVSLLRRRMSTGAT